MKKTTILIIVLFSIMSNSLVFSQGFITTWKTDNAGSSSPTSITIPTFPGETYNYNVDWDNDGVFDEFGLTGDVTHDFGVVGTYTVNIEGDFPRIYFNNLGDKQKIQSVLQWGNQMWTSMERAFYGCEDLVVNTTNINPPNLSIATNLSHMFQDAKSMNNNIGNWDVSNVTDMSFMFSGAILFNQDIGTWDTSNVTNMTGMFFNASAFNQDIGNWDTGNVLNLSSMFRSASSFNQDIGGWDTGNVTGMFSVFREAIVFNQDIGNWNTGNAIGMTLMFNNASSFNQDISNWDTSNVTVMIQMFSGASSFDQDLGVWNISNVTDMTNMFFDATLSAENYDNMLIGWNAQNLQNGVTFHGGNSTYCNAETARNNMVASDNWIITDGGLDCVFLNFITTWKTNNIGTSSPTSITIPTFPGETYLYDVDWDNDGVFDDINVTGNITHDYGVMSTPTVSIRGNFPRIYFNNEGDKIKIQSVEQWGGQIWTSMENAFYGCTDLVINVTDINPPNLTGVSNMSQMFRDAKSMNSSLNWDTSSVTDLSYMFNGASAFNQNINNWNTSNVTDMSHMFRGAEDFNQSLNGWDTSSVINMSYMFRETEKFNQNLNDWNTSNVTDMSYMFREAEDFNQNLNGWDTSNVTNMTAMFFNALNFNQGINNWDISNVINASQMFQGALSFNQDISNWNTANVTDMSQMFRGASSFNKNIGSWNSGNVIVMSNMFRDASSFNQDISSWNTSNVTAMNGMFMNASFFNRSLGDWSVSNVVTMENMFFGVTLSTNNYDNMLQSWDLQNLQDGVSFHGGNSKYCNGEDARNTMMASDNWLITDGGLDCDSLTHFITIWETDAIDTTITIPTFPGEAYNYAVDWENDGVFDDFGLVSDITHDFGVAGVQTIAIRGAFPRIYFNNNGDKDKIISIQQWGNQNWSSFENTFYGCSNLSINASDNPNLSNVSSMSRMLALVNTINSDISTWDTSAITDMSFLFFNISTFNQDISGWNTSNVQNMTAMFSNATTFNQNISTWNTSNVENMNGMFFNASSFNKDIGSWNTGNVLNMNSLFENASAFNQDIGNWNVSNVVGMESTFANATSFNQDISDWNTISVTDMRAMFYNTIAFNQNIGNWDTRSVILMDNMFSNAIAFNQNIGSWDVRDVDGMSNMFLGVTLSTENYDSLLIGWDAQNLRSNLNFHGGNSTYCNGQTARNNIITTDNWIITDGGLDCSTLSIDENVSDNFRIYPNPVERILFLSDLTENATIEIVDITGKIIMQTEINESQKGIDVSALKNAIYFIRVKTENQTTVKKFVKK